MRKPLFRFMPLAAAVLLAGCAVGPDYRVPELALPMRWPNAPKQAPRFV